MELILAIIILAVFAAVMVSLLHSMRPRGHHIHFHGDPDPDCNDCHGTGIINEGDEHFECECPCTMRIVDT